MDRIRNILARIGGRWLLLIGFVLCCSVYEYGRIMHMPPLPMHVWRQTDCLSLTANFHRGEGRFLAPVIHARIADDGESGHSAGELPLLYWAVGQLWKITGPSEFVYRAVWLLLLFMGLYALFRTLQLLQLGLFWSIGIPLLLFTSPVIVYYGIGFLTDVPAFSLALVGWYHAVRHAQEQRRGWWVLSMAAFALGAGLKVTAGMGLVALLGLYFLVTVIPAMSVRWRGLFPRPLFGWGTALLSLLPVVAWYVHAERYNTWHHGRYTFNSLWPIWEMDEVEIQQAIDFARRILVYQVFDTSVWLLFLMAGVLLLAGLRKVPLPLVLLNVLLIIGAVLYTLFWFHAVDRHDYYFINPIITPLVLLVTVLWWLHRDHPGMVRSRWVRGLFAVLLVYNVAYAANNMAMRSNPIGGLHPRDVLPLYHGDELLFWNSTLWGPLAPLMDLREALDAHGIGRDLPVIVPDDHTINASLYFMDRPGFTAYANALGGPADLERCRSLGAGLLVLVEPHWEELEWLAPYLEHPLLEQGRARVYDLRGLPRQYEEEVLLAGHGHMAPGLPIQIDTVPCATPDRGWCLGPERTPFTIFDIPLGDAEVVLAELHVRGRASWHRSRPKGSSLQLFQLGAQDTQYYTRRWLPEGDFHLIFRVDPQRSAAQGKLYLENQSGAEFQLRVEEVVVRRFGALR
jgi:hypothetical protein